MSTKFVWLEEDMIGVTLAEPEEEEPAAIGVDLAAAAEIARIDAVLQAAGEDFSFGDAAPSPLYVYRPVLNGIEIVKWARSQGYGDIVDAEDMHVTVAYSRTAVDWMEMGVPWEEEIKTVGGPRMVDTLGEHSQVILFASSSLTWRHEDLKASGASWDYAGYKPHITFSISKVVPEGVVPYRGEIRLGPEVFEELKDSWGPVMDKE